MVTFKDVKNYYNNCYKKDVVGRVNPLKVKEGVRPYEAYEYILDFLEIKKSKGLKLLDIACGRGFLLKAASARGFETAGIDISNEAIKFARKNAPSSNLRVGVAESLPFKDNYFDVVFCLGSLEHFLDQAKAIREIKRVSKNNAIIYIMVPNKDFIYYKFVKHKGTHQHEIRETLKTNEEWIAFLKDNGLLVQKVLGDDYNFKQRIFSNLKLLFIFRMIVLRIVGLFLPLRLGYQFIYLCKKV